MKKLLFSLLVFMTIFSATKDGPFRFGVIGGMNITKGETSSKVTYKGWSPDTENAWFAGLQLKGTIPVVGLGLDVSLLFSQETVSLPGDETTTETDKLAYFSVPLHLRYDLSIPGVNLLAVPFVFTGPQANLAISKVDRAYLDNVSTKDLVWRYDLGAGLILFDHLQAAYSYSFPLSKTYEGKFSERKDQFDNDYKQGVHRISFTYFF